ncbi:MAG: hypothetical protein HYY84_17650 [Deltaproteobacteria bacterium]|nr:hypothetical protein [Deltaproteobacteria bacterium]
MKSRTPQLLIATLVAASFLDCGAGDATAPAVQLPAKNCPSVPQILVTLNQISDGGVNFPALSVVIDRELVQPANPSYPSGRLAALIGVFLDIAKNTPIENVVSTLTTIGDSPAYKPLLPLLEGALRYIAGLLAAPNNITHYNVTTLIGTMLRGCDGRDLLALVSNILRAPNFRQLLTLIADLTADATFNQLLDNFQFGNCDPAAAGCIGRDGFIALLSSIFSYIQSSTTDTVASTFATIRSVLSSLPIIDITKPPWSDLMALGENLLAQASILTPLKSLLACHQTKDTGGAILFGAIFDLLALDEIKFKDVTGAVNAFVALDPDGKILGAVAAIADYLRQNLDKYAILVDIVATILEQSRISAIIPALIDLITIRGPDGKTAFEELMTLLKYLSKGCAT